MEAKFAVNFLLVTHGHEFFPTARALIGYFEVTWDLTNKLFPAKISERATLQNLWYQKVTGHRHWLLARFVFINLYMKTFFFVGYSLSSTLGNSEILGKQTVSPGTSHQVPWVPETFLAWFPVLSCLLLQLLQSWTKVLGTVMEYSYFSVIPWFPNKTVHPLRNVLAVLPTPPYTNFKLGKLLNTCVQHCLWGEGSGWTCVNQKTPQKCESVPRFLSMIVGCA